MNKLNILHAVILCALVTACGAEKKQQVIIPQGQLEALEKAQNLENELLKMQKQQEKQLQSQGL